MEATANKHRDGKSAPMDDASRQRSIRRIRGLTRLMDNAVTVPGTNFGIGLDGIAGLVPGVGDTFALLVSLYIVWEARRMGVSDKVLGQMLVNVGLDWAIGLVPVVGDAFDFVFKANRRNMRLMGIDPDAE